MENSTALEDNPWMAGAEQSSSQDGNPRIAISNSQTTTSKTTAHEQSSPESSDSDSDSTPDDICQDCRKEPGEWYCGACTQSYCERCWKKRPGHKKKNPDSANHMKVPYSKHVHFEDILHPNWDEVKRALMHEEDLQSLWFSITADAFENSGFGFDDFPRFSRLVAEHQARVDVDTCFPRLVSFVGKTGAGKSTLIRTMLEKPWLTDTEHGVKAKEVPVVGKRNSLVPASGDVHLYGDYLSERELPELDRPTFYADCEGFDGGAANPAGSFAYKSQQVKEAANRSNGRVRSALEEIIRLMFGQTRTRTLGRLSPDANKGKEPTREDFIKKLFPRLLYNFSDVVVFVVKEQQTLGNSILDILDWAFKSAASALNRATLPRLIVVINNADQSEIWDPKSARKMFFEDYKNVIEVDPNIKSLRESFIARGMEIKNLEDLFLKHYASLDVIFVPNGHIRSQLSKQLRTLYDIIQIRTRESQQKKHDARMLLPSQDQEYFFQLAFDHYVANIKNNEDKPFNFLAKMLKLHPMPNNLSNNFYRLFQAIYGAMEADANTGAAKAFLDLATPPVSSAIALNVARSDRRVPGKLAEVYQGGVDAHSDTHEGETYAKQVKKAISQICDWSRCEFANDRFQGRRCFLSRQGHGYDQHQDESGAVIGAGDFESEFVNVIQTQWEDAFLKSMDSVDRSIERAMLPLNWPSSQHSHLVHSLKQRNDATWDVHYSHLRALFHRLPSLADKTAHQLFLCFFCFREVPLQSLPCGHAICERCVKALVHCQLFSSENDKRVVALQQCPLHCEIQFFEPAPQLQLKPAFAGARVLTLDGGGVRGLIELKLLNAVQKELGGNIPIQRFFDLIGGTSTGGIIALGIGTKDWTLAHCEQLYPELCKSAFTTHGSAWSGNAWAYTFHGCRYQNVPFENKLKEVLGESRIMGLQHDTSLDLRSKVFVTSTKSDGNQPAIFTNYIRAIETEDTSTQKLLYDYEMKYDETLKLESWEVARATSAAPMYFRSFAKDGSPTYWDGGLCHNNPAWIARQEVFKIWPELSGPHPDILLSIGSGYVNESSKPRQPEQVQSKWSRHVQSKWSRVSGWFLNLGGLQTLNVLKATLLQNLDSEHAWKDRFSEYERELGNERRYFRLSPQCGTELPELDDLAAFESGELAKIADEYLADAGILIKTIVRRLITTSFYFEPDQPRQTTEDGQLFTGKCCSVLNC
ncbi:hypothetical protein BU16DRAFT_558910 [Lophium mytilinum]|uniref:FabD/lysophospholipase-like protein n=1 Tax=Lophium mytilinum TaxID=390894 RepID=A0A6A6R3E5_9PEZI|nr:hypothetical protein BU16DRAFT_558910 [Lophium mytilinum]